MAEEYIIPLGIDATNTLKGFRDIEAGLDALQKKAEESGKAVTDAMSKGGKEAEKMTEAVEQAAPAMSKVVDAANSARQAVDKVRDATEKMGAATKDANDPKYYNEHREAFQRLRDIVSKGRTDMSAFAQVTKRTDTEFKFMSRSIGEIEDRMRELSGQIRGSKNPEKIRELNREFERLQKEAQRAANAGKEGFDRMGNKIREVNEEAKKTPKLFDNIGAIARRAIVAVGALFAVNKLVDWGKQIIATTADFQKFTAMLKVALGSASAANSAMNMISDFAAKPPFQVDEVTAAFVKLANRGIVPTAAELTKMGDLAASQGKSFDQLTEAILDAMTGEFERMKEFGIKAKKSGDEVQLSFKGVTTVVKNNEEAIKRAVLEMGNMAGVAGSMEEVSKTMGGAISNMTDAFTRLFSEVGKLIAPFVTQFVTGLSNVIGKISELINSKERAMKAATETAIKNKQEADSGQVLLNRYVELKDKGVKATTAEKKEMQSVMQRLINTFGESIVQINKETGAMEINIEATKSLIKQKYILANQTVADLLVQEQLAKDALARTKELTKLAKAEEDRLRTPENVALGQKAVTPVGRSGQTLYSSMSKEEKALVDQMSDARERLNEKLGEEKELQEQLLKIAQEKKKLNLEGFDLDQIQADEAERMRKAQAAADAAALQGAPTDPKKAAQLQKQQYEQIIALTKQLRDARIAALEDGYNKERKLAEAAYEDRVQELNSLEILTDEAARLRDANLKQAAIDHAAALKAIDKKELEDRLALEFEYQKTQNDLAAEGLARQLEAVRLNFEAQEKVIREKYKDREDLETTLLADLAAARKREEDKIHLQEKLRLIDQQNDLARAMIGGIVGSGQGGNIVAKGAGNAAKVQEIQQLKGLNETEQRLAEENKITMERIAKDKALLLLAIEIKSAEDRLRVLQAQDPNSHETKMAAASLESLKAEFKEKLQESLDGAARGLVVDLSAIGSSMGTTLKKAFEAKIGANGESLGSIIADSLGLSDEEMDTLINNAAAVFDTIGQLYSQMIDEQIRKKDEQINVLSQQIAEAEKMYDREIELQKQGYANNAEAKKQEIAELKKARDKEQKDKEALQKKEAQVAKAQIAVQTAVTLASLIAAAAQAIAAHASIPFVGVAFGLAAVAALMAGYMAFKAQSEKAAQSTQSFEVGGWIDGKRHTQGGKKYYSPDGGSVVELEEGEHVTRRKQAQKHSAALDAINVGDFTKLTTDDITFREMLAGMGIHLMEDKKQEALENNRELSQRVAVVMLGGSNGNESYLRGIEENTAVLAQAERDKETVTIEGDYKVVKRGNVVRKIKIERA